MHRYLSVYVFSICLLPLKLGVTRNCKQGCISGSWHCRMHIYLLLYAISICLLPLNRGISTAVVHFGKLALSYLSTMHGYLLLYAISEGLIYVGNIAYSVFLRLCLGDLALAGGKATCSQRSKVEGTHKRKKN